MNSATVGAIASRGAAILASFALTVVVARLVGVEFAGTFFLIAAIVTVLSTIGRFGSDTMAVKLVGGEVRADATRTIVGRLAILTIVGSSTVTFAGLLAVYVTGFTSGGASQSALLFALTAVVAQSLFVFAGAVLRATQHIAIGVFAELGSAPLLAVFVLLLLNTSGAVTLDHALVVFTATSWFTAGWSMGMIAWSSRRDARLQGVRSSEPGVRFDARTLRSLASMMGVAVVYFASVWSPIFLLSALDSLASVALYTAAVRLANIVGLVPSIQTSYLAPRFAPLIRSGELAELNRIAGRSAFVATIIASAPALVMTLGSVYVVQVVYGEDYAGAAPLLAILVFGAIAVVALGQVNQLALLAGLEHAALLTSVLTAVVWLTGGAFVVALGGAFAAAVVASVINLAFATTLCAFLRNRGIRSWAVK